MLLTLTLFFSITISAEVIFTETPDQTLSGDMVIDAAEGSISGSNLFHSFDTFNVQIGESATFTGP